MNTYSYKLLRLTGLWIAFASALSSLVFVFGKVDGNVLTPILGLCLGYFLWFAGYYLEKLEFRRYIWRKY